MIHRALLSLILIATLLLAACGGDDDDDSLAGGTASDEASVTAQSDGTGSDSGESDGGSTGEATGEGSGGDASQATSGVVSSATLPPLSAEPSRTPRPTSTPFPTATALAVQPTSTPAPVPSVEVISSNVFRDPAAGSAIIFGEVQNTGDFPATGVQVSARLIDGGGDLVGRGESEAVGKTVVNPGDVVGFSIIVTFEGNVYTEWVSEELTVDFEFSRDQIVQAYTSDLTISGDTLVGPESGFDFVDVTGSLTNDSGMPLRFVQIGAIAYDASGNVISVDSFVSSDTLEPGATIPFAVEFSRGRLKEFPASYAFVVEGLDAAQ
jgi:hypothetical protein